MNGPMRWNDTVKATALAALAERTTPTSSVAVDRPWTWNPHDIWLSRIKPPRRAPLTPASMPDPVSMRRPGPAQTKEPGSSPGSYVTSGLESEPAVRHVNRRRPSWSLAEGNRQTAGDERMLR